MSTYRKWHFCSVCEDECLCTVKGEIAFPPPYAIGAPPGPDFIRAYSGTCEHGHTLSEGESEAILDDIAAGDVF